MRNFDEKAPSPKDGRRGCMCKDGTYSNKCCDGSFFAQGIGNITKGTTDSAGTIINQNTERTITRENG